MGPSALLDDMEVGKYNTILFLNFVLVYPTVLSQHIIFSYFPKEADQ
jgi:hypothetical protein